MADQDAVALAKAEALEADPIAVATKDALGNPTIPIQASSLERLVMLHVSARLLFARTRVLRRRRCC